MSLYIYVIVILILEVVGVRYSSRIRRGIDAQARMEGGGAIAPARPLKKLA